METPPRAIGVEVRLGEHLFQADPNFSANAPYETMQIRCKREVILAGGTFNSPQLLMLSGIGPADRLNKLGLRCISDLPGVGQNLQDRYEVAIIHQMREDFGLLKKCDSGSGESRSGASKSGSQIKRAFTRRMARCWAYFSGPIRCFLNRTCSCLRYRVISEAT